MPSPPLDITHGRQRRAWHDIFALGQHAWSDDIGHGISSPPLGSTHGRTTSGVACDHLLWTAHTVKLRRAWQAIIAFGQHKRSNDIDRCMPSSPLGSTHGRMTSAWHAIIAHGRQTRSNSVGHKMPSSPLGSTHDQTTSGVACRHGP